MPAYNSVIRHLNTLLDFVTCPSAPDYAIDIYEGYINQLWSYLQVGDVIECNGVHFPLDAELTNAELKKKIEQGLTAFLSYSKRVRKLEFSDSGSTNFDDVVSRLQTQQSRAEGLYYRASRLYESTLASIENTERELKGKKQKVQLFAESFASQAPSTFSRELAVHGITSDQTDFQEKLAQIFLDSSFESLQTYFFHAIKFGSAEIVELFLRTCVIAQSCPLKLRLDDEITVDAEGNTILHIISIMAQSADTPMNLEKVLRRLNAVLETVEVIKREKSRVPSYEIGFDEKVNEHLEEVFLLENASKKTVIELLLQANKFKLFLLIRTYITPKLIANAMSARSSELEQNVYKHLLAYETRLRKLEDKPDTKTTLGKKCAAFNDIASYPDEFYNRLIQRRKALESLWIALWIANTTGSLTILIEQIRLCSVANKRYSEPGVLFAFSDALMDPLVSFVNDYRRVHGPERVGIHLANAGAGVSLASLSIEASPAAVATLGAVDRATDESMTARREATGATATPVPPSAAALGAHGVFPSAGAQTEGVTSSAAPAPS